MISLVVAGTEYTNWTRSEVTRSLSDISGSFVLDLVADKATPFPVRPEDPCTILINGQTVLTGYVDSVEVEYSYSQHIIRVQGRDVTCDIVDSHCDNGLEFKAPISMEEVCRKTLEAAGLSNVQVKNTVQGLKPFSKEELISGKIGEKCFDFMDKYALKRQVVLTTDGLGSLVIARASTESTGYVLQNSIDNPFNTILRASVIYDHKDRYNKYIFVSQANYSADPKKTEKVAKTTHRRSEAIDSEVRATRQYVAIDEGSSPEAAMKDRASWEKNIRKANSFKYKATLVGHSPVGHEGVAYKPNELFQVEDDWASVYEELLVVEVVCELSVQSGSLTTLTLMSRDAFELLREQNAGKGATDSGQPSGAGATTAPSSNSLSSYNNDTSNFASKYKEKR